jgi:hypothetical protein
MEKFYNRSQPPQRLTQHFPAAWLWQAGKKFVPYRSACVPAQAGDTYASSAFSGTFLCGNRYMPFPVLCKNVLKVTPKEVGNIVEL